MSMRRAWVVALFTLAACGGGSGGGTTSNAATDRSFNYGSAQSFSGTQLTATGSQLKSLSTMSQGASATAAEALATGGLADQLLGSSSALAAAPADGVALHRALMATRPALVSTFTEGCATETATSVTFNHCTATDSGTTVTLDGSFTVAQQQLTWNFTMTVTSTSTSGTLSASVTERGDVTVTSTAITGSELVSSKVSMAANGTTYNAGLDESLTMDVTLDPACATGAVAGSIEAKRVWTARPSGYSSSDLRDAAVKVTWTACGAATVQYSL